MCTRLQYNTHIHVLTHAISSAEVIISQREREKKRDSYSIPANVTRKGAVSERNIRYIRYMNIDIEFYPYLRTGIALFGRRGGRGAKFCVGCCDFDKINIERICHGNCKRGGNRFVVRLRASLALPRFAIHINSMEEAEAIIVCASSNVCLSFFLYYR